jgi:hypothetical protein
MKVMSFFFSFLIVKTSKFSQRGTLGQHVAGAAVLGRTSRASLQPLWAERTCMPGSSFSSKETPILIYQGAFSTSGTVALD